MKIDLCIDNVKYQSKESPTIPNQSGCTGCAFHDRPGACRTVYQQQGHNHCKGIIWVKAPPPAEVNYPLSHFIEALTSWEGELEDVGRTAYIAKYLKNKQDPEYQEYLRLKEKFKE